LIDDCGLCLDSSVIIEPPVVVNPPIDLTTEKFEVGRSPTAIIFDGTHIWVTTTGDGGYAHKLDLDGTVVGKYKVGGGPSDIIRDYGSIWTADTYDDTVTKLDAATGNKLGTYDVGDYPIALVSDGSNVWVANKKDSNVMALSTSDGQNTNTYTTHPADRQPVALEFDGTNIWIGSHWGQLDIFKAADASEVVSYTGLGYISGLASNGEYVYNTAWYDGGFPTDVKKYSVSGEIWSADSSLAEVLVSSILHEGENLWISASVENKVYKLRASDGSLLDTYEVGDGPVDLAFDGTNIWIALSRESAVMRLVE